MHMYICQTMQCTISVPHIYFYFTILLFVQNNEIVCSLELVVNADPLYTQAPLEGFLVNILYYIYILYICLNIITCVYGRQD